MKLKFYFEQCLWADTVRIHLVGEDAAGKRFLAKPMKLEFTEINREIINEPTLEVSGFISKEFLPALANGLSESGYRAESSDAGELKATKAHLADMRKLALKDAKEPA